MGALAVVNCQGWGISDVNVTGIGRIVTGTIDAYGCASNDGPAPSHGWAWSAAQLAARGGLRHRNGVIEWQPVVRAGVAGGMGIWHDPISMSVFDEGDNLLLDATLLDIVIEASDGEVAWNDQPGLFYTAARWAQFHISMPGVYTTEAGTLDLEVANGAVTQANATGLFAGITLPTIGSAEPVSLNLPETLVMNYDMGDFGDQNFYLTGSFSGSGEVEIAAVPEPSSLMALICGAVGVLGFRLRRSR